jgi:hypothetical protein
VSSDRLLAHLHQVETLLDTMAGLLVRGDAPAFELSATALRQAMLELAHATALEPSPNSLDPATRTRLQSVSQRLVRQRENLARRAVVAERALAAVLPHPSVTYSAPGRAAVFQGPTARLYTTPAI